MFSVTIHPNYCICFVFQGDFTCTSTNGEPEYCQVDEGYMAKFHTDNSGLCVKGETYFIHSQYVSVNGNCSAMFSTSEIPSKNYKRVNHSDRRETFSIISYL